MDFIRCTGNDSRRGEPEKQRLVELRGEATAFKYGVFKIAFALDSGNSAEIKKNLKLAMDRLQIPGYDSSQEQETNFDLVRRGSGQYLLLSTP